MKLKMQDPKQYQLERSKFLFACKCLKIYILVAKMSDTVAAEFLDASFFGPARLFGLVWGTATHNIKALTDILDGAQCFELKPQVRCCK